jgi:hypothetical protein
MISDHEFWLVIFGAALAGTAELELEDADVARIVDDAAAIADAALALAKKRGHLNPEGAPE